MERIQRIAIHLQTPSSSSNTNTKNMNINMNRMKHPDDVVIISALRTPITKAKRGGFKDTTPDILLTHVFNAIIKETGITPEAIEDIVIGNVLEPGAGAAMARMAQLCTKIPHQVPLTTVNRQCSSGLQAIANVASAIKAGYYDIGLAGGVESMTIGNMTNKEPPHVDWEIVKKHEEAKQCTIPMGITSENVAAKYGITREEQDAFAAESQSRALKAQEKGYFTKEIVPVQTQVQDSNGKKKRIVVERDEGIRPGTTVEKLSRLQPAFKKDGSTTAGNSSQVSDGAAGVLLARRSTAERMKLPIIGKFVDFAVAGVPPAIMGIGPAVAIPKVLAKAGFESTEIDLYEINEAFASQALFCVKKLGLPLSKVNPNGGAIALGHPLGCTGSRQAATLLSELKRTNQRYGIISMCIGTGMGAAAILERE